MQQSETASGAVPMAAPSAPKAMSAKPEGRVGDGKGSFYSRSPEWHSESVFRNCYFGISHDCRIFGTEEKSTVEGCAIHKIDDSALD